MKKLFLFIGLFISLSSYSQDTIVKALDEVSVYSIRVSKKAPISESTIKSSDLAKSNQSFEASTFISRTPSVTMSTDNGTPFGYTYFKIRGVDQSRINVTLNGIPLNDSEDQGVFLSNLPSFMENVKSLQVQRGVGTSSNGTSSFGGSINFQTADYIDKELSLKYNVGSFNTARIGSTYSTGLKNKFAMNINASTYRTDGYKYGSGGKGQMVYLNGGYFGENNTLKFTSILGTSRNGMAWLAVSEDDIKNNPRTNYNQNDAWDNFYQSISILEYKRKFSTSTNLSTSVFYNKLEGTYDYIMDGTQNLSINADFYGVVSNLSYKTPLYTVDLGISGNKFKRKHMYSFADTNVGNKSEFSSYLKTKVNLHKFSLFLDTQYRFAEFNYNGTVPLSNVNWSFFNPKGGVTYNLGNSLFYYSVGLSHREPTRTNMFNGNDYLGDDGFNNVKAESVVDHEIGFKHFCETLSFQGNFFYMNFNNEILPYGGSILPSGLPATASYNNSSKQGLEIDLSVKFSDSFSATVNQTMMTSKVHDTNTEAILTPNTISNVSLTYTNKRFSTQFLTRTQGESYLDIDNTYSIPSFTTVDVNASYKHDKFLIMLTIGNLTNQKYYTNGNVYDGTKYFYVNAPLNTFLTLKYNL